VEEQQPRNCRRHVGVAEHRPSAARARVAVRASFPRPGFHEQYFAEAEKKVRSLMVYKMLWIEPARQLQQLANQAVSIAMLASHAHVDPRHPSESHIFHLSAALDPKLWRETIRDQASKKPSHVGLERRRAGALTS
jgi:hypothetical protein